MKHSRILLPEAEHLQLHPEDYRHPRNRARRHSQTARRLALGFGLLLVIAALVAGAALAEDILPTAQPVWETHDWPIAP